MTEIEPLPAAKVSWGRERSTQRKAVITEAPSQSSAAAPVPWQVEAAERRVFRSSKGLLDEALGRLLELRDGSSAEDAQCISSALGDKLCALQASASALTTLCSTREAVANAAVDNVRQTKVVDERCSAL